MSVKSRILQFQQNTSQAQQTVGGSDSANNTSSSANNFINTNSVTSSNSHSSSSTNNLTVIKRATIATVAVTNRNIDTISNPNANNCHSSILPIKSPSSSNNKPSHFPLTLPPAPNTNTTTIAHNNKVFNSSSNNIPRLHNPSFNHQKHHDYNNQHQLVNGNSNHKNDLRKSDPINGKVNTFYGIGVDISLNSKVDQNHKSCGYNSRNMMSGTSNNPPINRANKPVLEQKKASMTINLSTSTSSSQSLNENGEKLKLGKSPTRTFSTSTSSPSSAIPKPFGSNAHLQPSATAPTNATASNGVVMRKTGSSSRNSPATTPTRNFSSAAFSSPTGNTSSSSRLYGTMGWKEKYEESEKKRNHLVNLAQKATRDYEELRRRFHDVYSENEKLVRRLDGATTQLDSLRKASEAVYDDYYKLKKRYEAENREKSDALSRVDQYNKENRRLKRQSAAMMMQITDPTSLASAFDAVCETDSADNDKEILYLRNRVQELENKVVDLDSELEKAKLAEFETQESVMLINDSVNSVKSENNKLQGQLKQLDEENRNASSNLEDITFEYESLKGRFAINEEKLVLAETELKKILNEKNILQRQSLVFMNDAMDNRLMDALNQIGDMQTTMEEQRNRFETQLGDLQNQLAERESQLESMEIETGAKIRTLESQVKILRKRAEDAEQKLEDLPSTSQRGSPDRGLGTPPPPPPPPMPSMCGPPPPPPPPMPFMMNGSAASLNSSLKCAMGTLRKTGGNSSSNGSGSETPPNGMAGEGGNAKSVANSSPQIDDVISQLKKGIKLKPMDRTLPRKPTEQPKEKEEDTAVEEMRSILNNLRRTRRVN